MVWGRSQLSFPEMCKTNQFPSLNWKEVHIPLPTKLKSKGKSFPLKLIWWQNMSWHCLCTIFIYPTYRSGLKNYWWFNYKALSQILLGTSVINRTMWLLWNPEINSKTSGPRVSDKRPILTLTNTKFQNILGSFTRLYSDSSFPTVPVSLFTF